MFRNIVLPQYEEVNVLEQEAKRKVPDRGYFKTMEVGAGNRTMKMDERGFWMGSDDFDTAPLRIDMEGNMILTASAITENMSFRWYDRDGNLAIFIGFRDD